VWSNPVAPYISAASASAIGSSIKSLAPGDVITFHGSFQLPGWADDQRGMDMIVAEEVPYLKDGASERHLGGMPDNYWDGCDEGGSLRADGWPLERLAPRS
jgi:hypothetical protein